MALGIRMEACMLNGINVLSETPSNFAAVAAAAAQTRSSRPHGKARISRRDGIYRLIMTSA
jgi:hypothetical protein